MANIVFSNLMSLDGFCAGPGGDLNGLPMGAEFDQHNLDLLRGAGALLFGRVTFDLLRSFWPEVLKEIAPDPLLADIAGRLAKARKSVVSTQLTLGSTDPWCDARIVSGAEVNAHVRDLKAATDGDVVAFGSRQLMNALLGQGLVDDLAARRETAQGPRPRCRGSGEEHPLHLEHPAAVGEAGFVAQIA